MKTRQEFDYIIVGAGSAGCVLAARLSQDPKIRVALVEAEQLAAQSNAAFQAGFANGGTLASIQASVPGFTSPTINTVANRIQNPRYLRVRANSAGGK